MTSHKVYHIKLNCSIKKCGSDSFIKKDDKLVCIFCGTAFNGTDELNPNLIWTSAIEEDAIGSRNK